MKRLVRAIAACGLSAALATSALAQFNSGQVPKPPGAPGGPPGEPAEQPAPPAPVPPGQPGQPEPPQPVKVIPATDSADVDRTTIDQANRFLKLKRYGEAAPLFKTLRDKYTDSMEYQTNYALCLYETGKYPEAQDIYEKVLQVEPDNIQGLLSIARINCKNARVERDPAKQQELMDRAKEQLRRAAKNGANCLRAIKTYPEFKKQGDADKLAFENDVALAIALIKEPMHPVTFVVKDPFHNPLPRQGTGPGPVVEGPEVKDRWSVEKQREMVKRADDLMAQVETLLKNNDYEGVAKVWLQIEDILKDEPKIKGLDLIQQLNDIKNRMKEKQQVVKSLLLKAYFAQGERMIGQMQIDFDQQQYPKVFTGWEDLVAHAKRMTSTDPSFGNAAEDLKRRGQEWYDKAKILEEIDKLSFNITGIVAGASVAKAIINNRVLSENDLVYDPRGNPITDLRVAAIKKRRVRFLYKGLEFERPLVTPK